MKTIVVSAVNIRKGGTLTILKECLGYMSKMNDCNKFRIYALVHDETLCRYDNIEYINIPWSVKGWMKRLWCEYMTMYDISKKIGNVDLWFSLHDTTPRVIAKRQAVYLQTSFPFYKPHIDDLKFDVKVVIFSYLLKMIYKINASRNRYYIVQQEWLRKEFSRLFNQDTQKFIVAPPCGNKQDDGLCINNVKSDIYTFVFPATGDVHKNFQFLCRATKILESKLGKNKFKVLMTISGDENKYTRWLLRKWGDVDSLKFIGLQTRENLTDIYSKSDCLVFPSRIETWGLPISEFMATKKQMLLADKPYAHETSMGSDAVAFFSLDNIDDLVCKMQMLVNGNRDILSKNEKINYKEPFANDWGEIFDYLLNDE